MRAIILAAGQGTRLRPLTDDRPKCMVPLGGRPLVEYILESMRRCGLDDISIVTGYRADHLEALDRVTCYHNAEFAETNMVHSLFCAEAAFKEDVVVCYSDIVFSDMVLGELMDAGPGISTVVDLDWRDLWERRMEDPLDDAETLRMDELGNIIELGQKPTGFDQIQGQYIGMTRFSGDAIRLAVEHRDALEARDPGVTRSMYMTDFLQGIIDGGALVRAVTVHGGWLEVDSTDDLSRYEADLERTGAPEWLSRIARGVGQ